jgi:CRISPR-associated endonuclease Csn1
MAQRRGFQSNRKKDRSDSEVKGMLQEISALDAEIRAAGSSATLGKLFHDKAQLQATERAERFENMRRTAMSALTQEELAVLDRVAGLHGKARKHAKKHANYRRIAAKLRANHVPRAESPADDHIRNRHTRRAMYEDEFEAICQAQRRLGHAELLTDDLMYGRLGKLKYPQRPRPRHEQLSLLQSFGIHGLLFFQRPMYWPRSAVGACELEPKQPRCPRADRRAQRFRLLQEVNNLRYVDPTTGEELRLDVQQRTLLLDKLARQEKMTFDQIRGALGFLEGVKFNLEKGKRSYLSGMVIDFRMARALGKAWHDRPEEEKDGIVELLVHNEGDDEAAVQRLLARGLTHEQADAALDDVDLPAGHVQLSLKAIRRLLPHLEGGLVYQSISDPEQSALHAAGYPRRDELRRRLFDRLPDPRRVRDCPIGDLPNPVVKRTLVELRKLVNAILREYGKPGAIHVEMGRDVKTRPKDKRSEAYRRYQEQISEMRQREDRRAKAAERLRENRITVSRDNINRYLLWEDQKHECMYSSPPRSIGFAQLFSGEVHVDHILPYSRCLDDSQNNKAVCFCDANASKGDCTPYEWLADSQPRRYEEVCQRAAKLMQDGRIPYAKYRRFLQKELKLDDFIQRQLNDTRYIARLAAEYLRCLFDAPHHVLGLKGQLTFELRHGWGIENLLAELPDSPAWQEQNQLRPGEKNRADHRHHAIDAVVVALTSRHRLQELSQIRRVDGGEPGSEALPHPWPGFRQDLRDAVRNVGGGVRAGNRRAVSHRAKRKVSGGLHDDKPYGPTGRPGLWVKRKPILGATPDVLSPNEIENIRDPGIRRIIISRLSEHGVEFGRGTQVEAKVWKQALADLRMPSGVPIKKVRVVKPDLTIQPIRDKTVNKAFVKPGSTHHLCIFEFQEDGEIMREPVFVTMLDAMKRLKEQRDRIKKLEKALTSENLSEEVYEDRRREGVRQILQEIPVVDRRHPKRPSAKFLMSLSQGEMVLVDWDGEEKILVFRTAASTTGQLRFTEHTDARKSNDHRVYRAIANSLIEERKARKVVVDRLGRVRWAND